MKRFVCLLICVWGYFQLFSQGVDFKQITLKEALEQAKAQGKMVFVDCYTTWCGPCKMMTEEVFPQKEAGDFFNAHFVNVKFDMEKGEGPALAKRYGIRAFPTFLILRPDGSVYHKLLGSGEADAFLRRVQEGMVEENSTGYLDRLYEEGNRDKAFLSRYIQSLLSIYEENKAKEVSAVLLGLLDESEKVDSSYWFIFESPALTKKGTDHFKYTISGDLEEELDVLEKAWETQREWNSSVADIQYYIPAFETLFVHLQGDTLGLKLREVSVPVVTLELDFATGTITMKP